MAGTLPVAGALFVSFSVVLTLWTPFFWRCAGKCEVVPFWIGEHSACSLHWCQCLCEVPRELCICLPKYNSGQQPPVKMVLYPVGSALQLLDKDEMYFYLLSVQINTTQSPFYRMPLVALQHYQKAGVHHWDSKHFSPCALQCFSGENCLISDAGLLNWK